MSQNSQHPQQASPEGLTFVLVVVVLCLRLVYEMQITLTFLGMSFHELRAREVIVMLTQSAGHPALYCFCIFVFPLMYMPLYWLFRLSGLITSKTADLTKGSIAQGELDE